VDIHHRSGGFADKKYAAIADHKDALSFSYDLSTDTLLVKAKVDKVAHDRAVGAVV
jgi:hypothetical protein